jgi:cytochrome c oxidase assembly factor CtaG
MQRAAAHASLAAFLLVGASNAQAHVLADVVAAPWLQWNTDPAVLVPLLLVAVLYVCGCARLLARSRLGRAALRWRALAFAAGWAALAIALVSPLDALSAALFSAHMVQHELLMIVAAPLLVLGRPLGIWLWALPPRARPAFGALGRATVTRASWHALRMPVVAWALHALALWIWHVPLFFEAALREPALHILQHSSFLASALLFWSSIFGHVMREDADAPAMLSLFTTMVHTAALGALLTLAPGLWYPAYIGTTAAMGWDPLHDQQLGGLVMWVPGGLAYLLAALFLAARWLGEKSSQRPVSIALEES